MMFWLKIYAVTLAIMFAPDILLVILRRIKS